MWLNCLVLSYLLNIILELDVMRLVSRPLHFRITVPGHFRMRPHAVCFDNRKATFGEKYVSVMIDVDVNWDNPSEEDKKALDILRRRSFAGAQIPEMKREYIEGWRTIDVSAPVPRN